MPTRTPVRPEKPLPTLAERVRAAAELLESIVEDRALLAALEPDERLRLLKAAGQVSRPDALDRRRLVLATRRERRAARTERAEQRLAETGIRRLREEPVYTTQKLFAPAGFERLDEEHEAAAPTASPARACYVCKREYETLHHFYDQLCPPCAELNWRKRDELADLTGRTALLTGGRVKIGYQAGLKLLRCGARLIVTTRFPRDSAARYASEPDFPDWAHRLVIHGLDLRHTPSVEAFCQELLATEERLDFIVNNACQTVRRPPDFYRHMMEGERAALNALPGEARALLAPGESAVALRSLPSSAELSQLPLLAEELEARHALFPAGRLDQDLQQVDLREHNSWRMMLDEVPAVELLEVQLVNAVAPFILNARLKALMTRTPECDKHIVNVSAMEGQFYRRFKTARHPHTNMAKAALNMMTRTSAVDYHRAGIHMNSVDTGWVTDEDPVAHAARKREEHRFHPPLDIVDGAARIVDPIIAGFNTGHHEWGHFLKDYAPTDW